MRFWYKTVLIFPITSAPAGNVGEIIIHKAKFGFKDVLCALIHKNKTIVFSLLLQQHVFVFSI